jgi:hypothetical protein
MSLLFTLDRTLEFIGWMRVGGLKSSTMSTYLSGVRMYHIAVGHHEPCLREPLVKLILKGQTNIDKLSDRLMGKGGKLPVTLKMIQIIQLGQGDVDWPMKEVRLFWALACLAWAGPFRIHELLSRNKTEVDMQTTLLWRDLNFGTLEVKGRTLKTLSVHVKSPKIDRVGNGDNIMVFQLDGFICLIAALDRYRNMSKLSVGPTQPVFRLPKGWCFNGQEMNKRLTQLTTCLAKYLPGGRVTSHLFRAGVARLVTGCCWEYVTT